MALARPRAPVVKWVCLEPTPLQALDAYFGFLVLRKAVIFLLIFAWIELDI